MYYILVPNDVCLRRNVFTDYPMTRDGRRVLTPGDLQLTAFSWGPVEIVNGHDLEPLMPRAAEAAAAGSGHTNTNE